VTLLLAAAAIVVVAGAVVCVSAREERILCRIDPAIHDAAIRRKGCRSLVMKGREYRGYVRVDADAVRTKRELAYWVGLALDYNKKAQSSREKTRR